jgi:chromosome segregation ATPase
VSDNVRIAVTATDNASDDFQRIGQNAARMGQQITTAGKSAGQGLKQVGTDAAQLNRVLDQIEANTRQTAQGLDKLAQSANKADDGIKKSRASMAAMGAAATTLAGFLSDAARAAAEEEAMFVRLETAVEATGSSYADYAVQIDQAINASERLSFADDEAAEALANLTATTGDTAEALNLLGLAQDLARGKGIELAAAANIVGRVAEGNTGILARYGIAIQEGATAQEALAAVQERYAGQAEAYANTTQGAFDRVTNSIANFVEEIGGSTGELQLILTLLPGVSAGFTLLGGAAGLALQGIQKLRASSTLAAAALGPVGLGIAGVQRSARRNCKLRPKASSASCGRSRKPARRMSHCSRAARSPAS